MDWVSFLISRNSLPSIRECLSHPAKPFSIENRGTDLLYGMYLAALERASSWSAFHPNEHSIAVPRSFFPFDWWRMTKANLQENLISSRVQFVRLHLGGLEGYHLRFYIV
jgi:hypothetical protein